MATSPRNLSQAELSSPRLTEACRRCGVNSKELEERDEASFAEDGLEPAVQRVRFEHAKRKRNEKIRLVIVMRDKIVKEEEMKKRVSVQASVAPGSPGAKRGRSEATFADKGEKENNLLAQERAQLERIALRQKQELEQMMAYEMKISEQFAENERKMRDEAKRKADAEALRKKRVKEEEERRARLTAEKAQREREEERQRRLLMEKEARAQKLQAQAEAKREKEMRKAAREAEIARQKKKEEMREATRQLFKQQQDRIMDKQRQMAQRDKERQEALRLKNQQLAEQQAAKVREARERVGQALRNQERLLQQQRREFDAKQENARRKQAELDAQKERDRLRALERANERQREINRTREQMEKRAAEKRRKAEEHTRYVAARMKQRELEAENEAMRKRKEQLDKDAARKAAYDQMLANQEAKKQAIFQKRKEHEEAVAKRASEEKVKDMVAQEVLRLREQDRLDAIERKRKMDEYNRQRILTGIQSESERVQRIKAEREEIIRQRRYQRDQAASEKKAIVGAFAKMRETGKLVLPPGVDIELTGKLASSADSESLKAQSPKTVVCGANTTTIRPATAGGNARGGISRKDRSLQKSKPLGTTTSTRPTSACAVSAAKKKSPRKKAPETKQNAKPKPFLPQSTQKATSPTPQKSSEIPTKDVYASKQLKKKKIRSKLQRVAALKKKLEDMTREQNEYMLHVLEQAQQDESKRETRLRKATKKKQRDQLAQLFGVERARASERIVRLAEEHQENIGKKVAELNTLLAQIPPEQSAQV